MKRINKKIKFFFDVLVKSLTKFPYYKEIHKANFKFSLKYLFFLFYIVSLIGSLIFAGSISILVLPKVPQFVASFENKAKSFYPKGLVVNIKDGLVSTNEKEPFSVDSLNSIGLNKGYDHTLTIDTTASVDDYKDKSTLVLVTKDSIITPDNSSTYKVYKIDQTTNYTVNENEYDKLISQISPYLKYIQPVLIALIILSILLIPFIGAGLSLLGQLLYLAIFSGILWLVVKLMKKDLTYRKLYQLSMHGSTLPILLSFIVSTVGIQEPFLLGTGILLIFMILVVNQFSSVEK